MFPKIELPEGVTADEEALYALAAGFMNLSAYAKRIKKVVEFKTKKDVEIPGIVVALSRVKKELKNIHPLIQKVKINNITTKSPLSELVFEKSDSVLSKLSSLYKNVKTGNDDFLTMALSTNEITIICSDRLKTAVLKVLGSKPRMIQDKLAALGLTFDPKYYELPNVTYSLSRPIAQKKIVLAETITTHTEIIYVFHQKDMSRMIELFEVGE